MTRSIRSDITAAAAESALLKQVVETVRWIGDGRKLTQTGALTLADARVLVPLLDTGDQLDPAIGDRVYKTKSSTELLDLSLIVGWAKVAGLVRVVRGRLVPVKKAAALLDRPAQLWMTLFESFPRVGPVFLPSGWGQSILRAELESGTRALLGELHRHGGAVAQRELCELVWAVVTAPYILDDASDQQLDTARKMNDRDVRRILAALARLGAVTYSEDSAELTALGRYAIGRSQGEPEPGDPVLRVTITLADVEPRVWRQLLIAAAMPLDRLHQVIQTAMGWENYHLHSFTDGKRTYGQPDPDLDFVDERTVRLGDLKVDRLYYTYDFGDGWEHEILLEPAGHGRSGSSLPPLHQRRGSLPARGLRRLRRLPAPPRGPRRRRRRGARGDGEVAGPGESRRVRRGSLGPGTGEPPAHSG